MRRASWARPARRAGATTTTVSGSHAVYVTQADTVAEVIATAARESAA